MIAITIEKQWAMALERMARKVPQAAARHAAATFAAIGAQFITFHARERLRGRPGLKLQHGRAGLGGATNFDVTGTNLDSLQGAIFIGPPATKYANVHEFGTKGAGGTLPDIVPKRAKWLVWDAGGKKVFAKRVRVPARLGWRDAWDHGFEDTRKRILDRTLTAILMESGDELA